MDKITDKVYLGGCAGAENEELLKQNNIKRVLSCMGSLSPNYKDKTIVQKIIELNDFPNQNILQYFKDSIKFIEDSDKVFVHCFAGVSRSATLVIAYFMWKDKLPYKKSYEFVNARRSIGPNFGFRKQLLILAKKLKEVDYDLEKLDFKDVVWPPKDGITYDFSDL